MTIRITLPAAWDAFRTEANAKGETRHEQCWDVVGEQLNKPIRKVVPEYYEKLELGDKNIAMSKRGEILDLYWGRIEQDGAALVGLGKALENLSTTINTNVGELAAHWSGESYDAFTAAMGKIRTTLDAYAQAAEKVGGVLLEAMTQARAMYQDYATATQESLKFDWISRVEQWHKMDDGSGFALAELCPDSSGHPCQKNNDEQRRILDKRFTTDRLWRNCAIDPCNADAGRVIIMYRRMVDEADDGRDKIRKRVRDWCDATNDFKEQIKSLLEIATGNLYKLAQSQAFSSLRIVGGTGGQPAGGEGDVGAGDSGYPSSGGGGYPEGGGSTAEPIVDPTTAAAEPEPTPEQPAPDAAMADPAVETTDPAADTATDASVTITDGDRTIGVTDGDGGHVKVTVTDSAGTTKTYDLDFDAASGLPSQATGAQPADGVEQVPARTDGKCVIQDGDVTITAERPLFAPDQITLTVDDGTGAPNTYALDFADAETPDTAAGVASTDQPQTGVAEGTADQSSSGAAQETPTEAPAEPANDSQNDNLTSPQASVEDARGSVSGVLVPEQPDGEAGLAVAPDAAQPENDTGSMVGAGLPMMGAPGTSSGDDDGRAGSGWSVHGDLFDAGEPVYSMHGVLGDDDADRTDR
jgi:uncharacterized protein YukE